MPAGGSGDCGFRAGRGGRRLVRLGRPCSRSRAPEDRSALLLPCTDATFGVLLGVTSAGTANARSERPLAAHLSRTSRASASVQKCSAAAPPKPRKALQ